MENKKKVLVTGASRGIGFGIATFLASKNYQVIGTATTQAGAEKITQILSDIDSDSYGIVLNLNDSGLLCAQLNALLERGSAIDIIINNAGMTDDQLFMRMKQQQWDDVVNVNLNGTFTVIKTLLRPMIKKRWGRIVNISSVVALTGNMGQANYCAAKAGMIAMSKSLAIEVARYGITVNCVAPGFIETDMTEKLPEAAKENLLNVIPLKRVGSVDDIVQGVNYLIAESGNYITGSTLNINGGMLMV